MAMHTYEKMWTFVQFQKSKLEDTRHFLIRRISFDSLKSTGEKCFSWKQAAYLHAFCHTVIGFVIVTVIASLVPELINDNERLAVFWVFMFTHLFLGFLTFIALYQDSATTLKLISSSLVVLQLVVLAVTSNLRSNCILVKPTAPPSSSRLESKDNDDPCPQLAFVSSRIVLPNFIQSLLLSVLLITYMYKKAQQVSNETKASKTTPTISTDPEDEAKQFQFAHITVIIEEVP